jgi:hypothetical protein
MSMVHLRTALERTLLLTAAMVLAGGCATTVFTQHYQREHALSDTDLKRIRFYTSSDVVLQRTSAVRDTSASEGGMFSDTPSNMVQEIVIPKGTPLVLLKVVRATDAAPVQTAYLQLALTTDAPAKSLWFSTLRSNASGRYELTPVSQLSEDAQPVLAASPAVRYDGFDYRVRDEGMWQVFLCVGEIMQAQAQVHVAASTH